MRLFMIIVLIPMCIWTIASICLLLPYPGAKDWEELLEKKTGKKYVFDVCSAENASSDSMDIFDYRDQLNAQFSTVPIVIE